MKPLLFVILLNLSLSLAQAIDIGWHSGESKTSTEIFELEQSADRVLNLNQRMEFDLGIHRIAQSGTGSTRIKRHRTFEFSEIEDFLKSERHKNLLIIWFDKTIMWNEKEIIADFVQKVRAMTDPIGYKRIIIPGAHSSGVHFVFDTAIKMDPHKSDTLIK